MSAQRLRRCANRTALAALTALRRCYANTHCSFHDCATPWEPAKKREWATAGAEPMGGGRATSGSESAEAGRLAGGGAAAPASGGRQEADRQGGGTLGPQSQEARGDGEGTAGQAQPQPQGSPRERVEGGGAAAPPLPLLTGPPAGLGALGLGWLTVLVGAVCLVGLAAVCGLYVCRRRPHVRGAARGPLL